MWFWWALASAIVSGVSVVYNKRVLDRGVHSSVVSLVLFAACTLVALPLMLLNSGPKVNFSFFVACLVAAFTFSIAKTIALSIYKKTNLSDIYPLGSLAPLTLYILSVLFLSEQIKTNAIIGIVLMVVGVYILNYDYHNKNLFHPLKVFVNNKFSQLFVVAILLANICAISEKVAINNTFPQSVYLLAFWENLFLTLFIGGYVVKTNKSWAAEIKAHLPQLATAGAVFTLMYYLVLFGFKDGPVALVSGVKKLEVLIVIVLSFIFFGERPGRKVYIATSIMLLAVFLIKL